MRCEHCGTTGEEDGLNIDKYGNCLCQTCYDEMMEYFREKYSFEKYIKSIKK
jgi:UDP-galactopyranose mutase